MEAPEWLFSRFYDQDGYVTEPLSIFLTKGKHEITVVSRREPMILHSIYLQNEESLFDYKTVYEQQKKDINKARAESLYKISKVLGCAMEDLLEK